MTRAEHRSLHAAVKEVCKDLFCSSIIMGQLFSSEEEVSRVNEAVGSLLYHTMLEGGAVPTLDVVHPRLLTDHEERSDSSVRLQEQLQQLQSDLGNRAPTYLKDLIGRLSSFSDEPRLAGLLGFVITLVMDMAYTSSKQSSRSKGKSAGSSSCQRVWELQEVMEEYLKRCRINLSDKTRLVQDAVRLEAQLSFTQTQLKACLRGGDCDSRSLRYWASGAAFHTQMLVHLAALEGRAEPLVARAALEQYKEDLTEILPAYRRFKSKTVCVVKCRGGLPSSCDPTSEQLEEGSMTGLTMTDREIGKSVTVSLAAMEAQTGRRNVCGPESSSIINLDLISTDQYTQVYLDYLFSEKGPVAVLENYFAVAGENLKRLRTEPGWSKKAAEGQRDELCPGGGAEDQTESEGREGEGNHKEDSLKLSIVETRQPEDDS